MNVAMTFKVAFRALGRNRLRSALTMLGIIIGVAAVIIMVGVGQGAKASIESQIASMGTNVLFIGAASVTQNGQHLGWGSIQTLIPEDVDAILRECPDVMNASPGIGMGAQVVYKNQNWSTQISGVSPSYLIIRDWQLKEGNPFSENDVAAATKVCLLGTDVVDNLFPNEDPVGKIVRIRQVPFQVLGVLQTRGQSGFGQSQDDLIIVPYTTLMKRMLNRTWLSYIMVSAVTQASIPLAQNEITNLLRQRHKIQPPKDDDFFVRNQTDIATAATATSTILTILLGSVASISLIVGGIGIMNIMLVSVRERTREIGIRMAVGARGWDILQQFLIEAVVLSAVGGIIGILLGIGGSDLVSRFAKWPTIVSPMSVVVAIGFSAGIGIFFGFYPARTASKLNPIDALRYE